MRFIWFLLVIFFVGGIVAGDVGAVEDKFTLVVLPDTQYYTVRTDLHDRLTAQIDWIIKQKETRNIKFVLHEGDMTELGHTYEWEFFKKEIDKLKINKVPFALVYGGHDTYEGVSDRTKWMGRNTVRYNQYLPLSYLKQTPYFLASFDPVKNTNLAYTFEAFGGTYLILALEEGPRKEVLDWANGIIAAHSTWKTIMVTHQYLHTDASIPVDWPADFMEKGFTPANRVWSQLVSKHKNMWMVFSGHYASNKNGMGEFARKVSTGINGNKVYQMLANYQRMDGEALGGGGYLRILEIDPKLKTVKVHTYSPYLNKYLTNDGNQFEFTNVDLTFVAPTVTPTKMPTLTATPTVSCNKARGDADCNGKIDLTDFGLWKKEYLMQLTTKNADFNRDGKIDINDFGIWKRNYLSL